MKRFSVGFLFLLLLALPALATDPGGRWQSSSGSQIQIWANMQLVKVSVRTQQGRVYNYTGQWTKFGDRFTYVAQGIRFNGVISNRNQIVVYGSNGSTTYWTRY